MKKLKKSIKKVGSIKVSIILFLLFAIFSGVGTFIESRYDTPTAWQLVYGSFYFALIQFFLGINLFCAIISFKMYKKLPLFLFHISFLFILFGAIITRYFGQEGDISIREGHSSDALKTSQSYILLSDGKNSTYKPIYLSLLGFNDLDLSLKINNDTAKLSYKGMVPHAKKDYKEGGEQNIIRFNVFSENEGDFDFDLAKERIWTIGGVKIAYDVDFDTTQKKIFIDENYILKANYKLDFMDLLKNQKMSLDTGKSINLKDENVVLLINDLKIRAYDFLKNVKAYYKQSDDENLTNALIFELNYKNEKEEFYLFDNKKIILGDKIFTINYGPLFVKLPFKVHLKHFELKRYISSNSPQSYKSYVSINDENGTKDYEIFMNNTLDYKGFRLFQSSYDKDEQGTILSVNYDPGKLPTYAGYFLLTLGLILNLVDKNSRFVYLLKKVSTPSLMLIFMGFFMPLKSSDSLESMKKIFDDFTPKHYENISKKEHFKYLERLLVQMPNEKIAPLHTLANDILEKIYKKNKFENMDAIEVFMKIMSDFDSFKNKNLIYVKNEQIAQILAKNTNKNAKQLKFAAFLDFFDENGRYILQKEVNAASRKNPNKQSVFEKDILKVDERVNILNSLSLGYFFKVFGVDKNKNWFSPYDLLENENSLINTQIYVLSMNYFSALKNAFKSGDYSECNLALDLISHYTLKNVGYEISQNKITAEIFLSQAGIFDYLMWVYLIAGFLLLILIFIDILSDKKIINYAYIILSFILCFGFLAHLFALILRWYVSSHAPWSNSYESMIYISWSISLSGILFIKKSKIALSLSSILSAIMLFGAHLADFDPQITNLVPVLQSHWLSIHVSVITASYGFFGLCALLGAFALILFCLPNNKKNANLILETSYINEISMILGLSLLVIGNFFGAIWANESWGRYWGWDSKETWALISILIYSIIVHSRFIKSLNDHFAFAFMSMFAYFSILMTYFGVNYFLTGMHSYAKGDANGVPIWIYIIFAIMILLTMFAYKNYKKRKNNG